MRRMQQAAGDEFQQAVAEALTESMKTQAQLFRYVNEMVANENMRGERDQAMENALKKITKNTGKRERSVTVRFNVCSKFELRNISACMTYGKVMQTVTLMHAKSVMFPAGYQEEPRGGS